MRSRTRRQILDALSDYDVFWLTLWGEARSEAFEGILAVACVIRNRTRLRHQSYRDVCLAPWQFSCWTSKGGESNHVAVMDAAALIAADKPALTTLVGGECRTIASHIMVDRFRDRTHGADHYYAPAAMVPAGAVPSWVGDHAPVCIIGGHRFYRLK